MVGPRRHSWWCALVSSRRGWPSLLSVVRSLSFVLVRRSFVLCRWRLAALVWGEVQWMASAVHCHWAIDGGRVALARRVAIEEGGVLTHFLSMTTTTPSSSSAPSTLPHRLPGPRGFVRGSVEHGPPASSIRGRSSSLAGCMGCGPRSRIRFVIVRRSWSSCGWLLSFLGSWDHLDGGDVVVGGCRLALGSVSRLRATVVGAWWLLVVG